MPPLLRLDKISLTYGTQPLLEEVSLQLEPGERVALIGRNGEGKSSLLRVLLGQIEPDRGTFWIRAGARMAFLAQDIAITQPVTVAEWVAAGLPAQGEDPGWSNERHVATVLSRLRLDPAARLDQLSGGTRRRALLAQALVGEPQILLLDEPTNHLDIETIEWLERSLLEFRGAVLFISHDRTFIDRLASGILELDRGALRSYQGNYAAYQRTKASLLAAEAEQRAQFDRRLAQEEVWIRQGVEARRTRNEGRVRALYALRTERRARRERTGRIQLETQAVSESGALVFETDELRIAFGERVIIDDLSVRIMRQDRIGLVGPNGIGKSTLIRALIGELEPSSGRIRRGSRLEVAYYDQERLQLDLDASVMTNVSGRNDHVIVNGEARHVAGYLRDFLFRPEQLNTPARALSGGERNRLLLARLFARPANLLVMDEPTNDLDIDTLELLEEFVANYAGTLLLVSHDRTFLDHVVTSLLVFEGEGRVQEFVGGYSDWIRYRDERSAERAGPVTTEAARPGAMSAGERARAAPRSGRLTWQAQQELSALPERLQTLEAEKSAIEARLADGAIYRGEAAVLRLALERLSTLTADIERAYERWAELEAQAAAAPR
jgi:ATP-binding cassette subfamily F protein uup